MRSRIAAVLAVCLLVSIDASAQANQLSFANITARPGEERVITLNGTFVDGMSGLVVTVLFDPSVIQVLDVSLTGATSNFTLQSRASGGRLTMAMAAA